MSIWSLDGNDPTGELIDRSGWSPEEKAGIDDLMAAFGDVRTAERRVMLAAQKFMDLPESDMRALHVVLTLSRTEAVTAARLARALDLSTAAITKLVDRLEAADHLVRLPHPTDKRMRILQVTASTRRAALHSVGRHQIGRVRAAARLTPAERELVARFLRDTARELTRELDDPLD